MVTRTVDAFGPVDILVNNAAITFPGDLDLPMKRHDLIFVVHRLLPLIAAACRGAGNARGEAKARSSTSRRSPV